MKIRQVPIETAQDTMRAKRATDIADAKRRLSMTDKQILGVYCADFRADAAADLVMLNEAEENDQRITKYVREYGTDIG